jgi:ABC-3C biological conflict system middle component
MSTVLSREVDAIQNAAVSAVLLWRFCVAYAATRQTPASTPLPVLFVPLPILFNEESMSILSSTQGKSGLRLFAGKFTDAVHSKTDILLSLEGQAKLLRPQTLEAFRLGLRSRLLFLDRTTAQVVALSETPPKSLPESVRPLLRNAEKLGGWFGSVSLFELGSVLHVTF